MGGRWSPSLKGPTVTRKLYTGPIVDVSFDLEVCQHSANCVRGMPEVFDTSARPWIDSGAADTPEAADRLRAVIATCPSGVLEIVEHQG